jgi:hypothetical protein
MEIIRRIALTINIVGLLACSSGILSVSAAAEQEQGLGASLSAQLFKALVANDLNAVRSIVEAGADLSRVNLKGQTAMDLAVDLSHFNIAQYLVLARRIEQRKMLKPALANKSAPKPVIPPRQVANVPPVKLTKLSPVEEPPKPVELASKAPKTIPAASATIVTIGSNSQTKPASAEQILRIKKTTTQQINRLLPDVEPSALFFIPKPKNKPRFIPKPNDEPSKKSNFNAQITPGQATPQPLQQDLPNRFQTGKDVKIAPRISKLKPQIKPAPLDKVTATQTDITRKRTEVPAARDTALKTRTPSIFNNLKNFLLPSTAVQPVLEQIIRNNKNDEPESASARSLPQSIPLSRLRKPLKNILLTLGDSATTGQSKLPRGIAEPDPCVRKRRGTVSFCIVPIDWPSAIEAAFTVNTSLYQGTRAIARYDKGKASHYHALYTSIDHDKIIKFLKNRYGPPTDIWKRMIAPFAKPRQSNPTLIWRSHDSETDKVTILEVRKFDDTRATFPDTRHGTIRLYPAGGPPVFPNITAHDIMSIDWAARSDHIDGASPALARSIRVQP